jgi:pimeloyl-ACP methyl ester carboxylesterase
MTEAHAVPTAHTTARRLPSAATLVAGTVLTAAAGIALAETFKLPVESSAPSLMVMQRHGRTHVSQQHGDGPTVIFESGVCTPLTAWSWIVQRLPDETPFLTYDRPGIGWSHSARPDWRQEYPLVLLDLLGVTHARPPYILVGHSIGGLLIRVFAERFPELVGGLVFVDPSPPHQHERSPVAREGLRVFREEIDRRALRFALRIPAPEGWAAPMRRLPDHLVTASVRAMGRYAALRAARQELDLSMSSWSDNAARLTSTSHPVAVVTSGGSRKADPDYGRLADEFAGLSEISRNEVIDEADHMSLLCDRGHAARVADAIQWVVDRCPPPASPDSVTTPVTAPVTDFLTTTETTP